MSASNVVPFQPTAAGTLRIIREVAQDSARIRLGPAMPTVFSVGISLRQILNCLKNGFLSDGPHQDEVGFVCCELEWITAGRRIRVVVSVEGRSPPDRCLHVLFAEEV